MPVLIAVVPQPPLLVPELAAGAAGETADLRAAVVAAGSRLAAAADEWIAVGADPGGRRSVPSSTAGTFVGFGRDVRVVLGPEPGAPDPELPLPLLVAGWVAGQVERPVRVRGELLAPDASTEECRALGRALAGERVGLLVVGDGSAMHTDKAPGHLDERAAGFDETVAKALEHGDPAALAALDPGLAAQLWAVGRAPWQALAGAAEGREWRGELLYSEAPYGVAYHVAVWEPA
ncbi:class III extradiol dioxygenase subunit B-like domain-containing protein [Pseudonocardia ailaonensis]|uniref:class III extradiol dioxygenase subunit B-like domain-containing protein n=1 Tax=Pseudonocardia ailaonensis TaxID=367279 RepID=UPI0031CE226F